MDLFDYMKAAALEKEAPLAVRMRPKTLEDVVGQEHILAKDKLLYRAIKADRIRSIIFYGSFATVTEFVPDCFVIETYTPGSPFM